MPHTDRLASDRPLLPVGASAVDERDLREILRGVGRGQSEASLLAKLRLRFRDDALTRAEFLLAEMLGDISRTRGSDPEVDGSEVDALADAINELPLEDALRLSQLALERARERQGKLEQQQLIRRDSALREVASCTQVIASATAALEYQVVVAKENGASWADIGAAAGVSRDLAFKRWSKLTKTEQSLDPTSPDAHVALGYIPRNAPCPCGSGRRFKQCHGPS